jgi:hypothetical protein
MLIENKLFIHFLSQYIQLICPVSDQFKDQICMTKHQILKYISFHYIINFSFRFRAKLFSFICFICGLFNYAVSSSASHLLLVILHSF